MPIKRLITPWGHAQSVTLTSNPEVYRVHTASHGGYRVTHGAWRRMRRQYPSLAAIGNRGWFEEDCAAIAVYLAFPELFPLIDYSKSRRMAWNEYPDEFRAAFPNHCPPDHTSYTLRRRAFEAATREQFTGWAAHGPWSGNGVPDQHVGLVVRRAADGQERDVLVPTALYHAPREFSYVCTGTEAEWNRTNS
jgi:hypothetical protein